MRSFTQSEQALLHVVEQFGKVKKYQGITPEGFLFSYDKMGIESLLDDDILEKAKLKSFSQKVKGVRLTPHGLRQWLSHSQREEELPVITRAGLIVRDIYLHNKLSYTGEAMPKRDVLDNHSKASLLEAFELGLVAKVKIRQKGSEVVKGYIVTNAGYAYLKGNKLI